MIWGKSDFMDDLKRIIAKNIVELRKSMNWTQDEFSEKLNYSDKAVSKWERAESIPDVIVLKKIVDLFNVKIDYLFEPDHKEKEDAARLPVSFCWCLTPFGAKAK